MAYLAIFSYYKIYVLDLCYAHELGNTINYVSSYEEPKILGNFQ